ncbi:MAG: TetM/TetW/TetO/TetS family tetracycline resistance ribosomal protection protein [Clostridia bacterium]|nr:TetM/TetW/TetO/TetS family tetracycline resistance ribosomal protection protein [Clostridia bacterium]
MQQVSLGIFAHVDAGKTTLCEALLYEQGTIRKLGRVDHRDSLFDSHELERRRGITIFSKQASFILDDARFTILDTPGHVDFVSEAERVLPVTDIAVFVVSGKDGIQAHGETLWRLIKSYRRPAVIFVTKMDLANSSEEEIFSDIRKDLGDELFTMENHQERLFVSPSCCEEIATVDEKILESYLEKGTIELSSLKGYFLQGKAVPVIFGSGLKLQGIDELLKVISILRPDSSAGETFSGRVFKISRDDRNNRLTHLRVTGGKLSVRDEIRYTDTKGKEYSEKITGIREYNGERFVQISDAPQGSIVEVTGLTSTYAGQGLGEGEESIRTVSEPVFVYSIEPEEHVDLPVFLRQLHELEEEDPLLRFSYDEVYDAVFVQLMGDVQIEILQELIRNRFNVECSIKAGKVLYKETIRDKVEGIGHYEPIRHYAEVHLILEGSRINSGISISSRCPTDELDKNWQSDIIDYLENTRLTGVLGNFPVTDLNIYLMGGRVSLSHTDSSDIREATRRAFRQGLMKADSMILEPYYYYELRLPTGQVGRAITDIRNMKGDFEILALNEEESLIRGYCPVSEMQGYSSKVMFYTSGKGRLSTSFDSYREAHDPDAVLEGIDYDPERDTENPADSIFFKHGAGFHVKWNEVEKYMHMDRFLEKNDGMVMGKVHRQISLDEQQVEEILNREFGEKRRKQYRPSEYKYSSVIKGYDPNKKRYVFIDGYNLLFADEELKTVAKTNIDAARNRLIDMMADYEAYTGIEVVVVFDAYLNSEQTEKRFSDNGVEVIYTDYTVTADAYLEKMANEIGKNDYVKVVSSDNLVRMGVFGSGVTCSSCRLFLEEFRKTRRDIIEFLEKNNMKTDTKIRDIVDEEILKKWKTIVNYSQE